MATTAATAAPAAFLRDADTLEAEGYERYAKVAS